MILMMEKVHKTKCIIAYLLHIESIRYYPLNLQALPTTFVNPFYSRQDYHIINFLFRFKAIRASWLNPLLLKGNFLTIVTNIYRKFLCRQ